MFDNVFHGSNFVIS